MVGTKKKQVKVAFIQGRPHAHPTHILYAKSVKSDFYFVDYKVRYHDLAVSSALRRYLSWFFSAFFFPKRKYDVFFSEEPYFMLGLMKWLGLINKKQKIVALMATHTLYFLNNNRYAKTTKNANIALLKKYDAFICVGEFQKKLLLDLIGNEHLVPIYTVFNGVNLERFEKLIAIKPQVENKNIVFIGAIPNGDRIWYKGIDLMLEAFALIKDIWPDLTFTIIGEYNPIQKEELLDKHCNAYRGSVHFVGKVDNIDQYLATAALYLHCSRGEAWGISVTEAMAAGVVPIISDCTGAMEVVQQVDNRLITNLEPKDIALKINWYLNQPDEVKVDLASRCKNLIQKKYTEDKAIAFFQETFHKMEEDLHII